MRNLQYILTSNNLFRWFIKILPFNQYREYIPNCSIISFLLIKIIGPSKQS
jgi:hypothetical protein